MTKSDGVKTNTALEFVSYGTKSYGDRSGAYLFLPDGPAKVRRIDTSKKVGKIYHLPLR